MRFFNPIRNNLRGVSAFAVSLLTAQVMAACNPPPCPPGYLCASNTCQEQITPRPTSSNPAPPSYNPPPPPKGAIDAFGVVAVIFAVIVFVGGAAFLYKKCGGDAQDGATTAAGVALGSLN